MSVQAGSLWTALTRSFSNPQLVLSHGYPTHSIDLPGKYVAVRAALQSPLNLLLMLPFTPMLKSAVAP